MNIEVFYSKKSDDWKTPSEIYKAFMDNGFIDPCPYQSKVDNLGKFYEHKKIFLNPPFSKMSDWVDYGIELIKNHNTVVFLIPSRTDTKYFHKLLEYLPEIYFIKGRLHYNDSEKNAPFPSIMLVYDWWIGGNYHSKTPKEIVEVINRL